MARKKPREVVVWEGYEPGPPARPKRPRPTVASQVDAQMQAELAMLRQIEQEYQQDLERRVAGQRQAAQWLAQALAPISGQIEGIVNRQTGASTGFAQGFADATRQLANQSAGDASSYIAQMGMPGAVAPQGEAQGDALYGEFGYIPATGFANYGAATAAAAAMMPGTALRQSEMDIAKLMADYDATTGRDFRLKKLELAGTRSERIAEARAAKRQETLELYQAGLITQRQFARRMGVRNWRKFPDVLPGEAQERPKADSSLSKQLGYLVDEYGSPILNAKGKPIYLPREAADYDTFGSASAGYWVIDPNTGKVVNVVPPVAPRAKTYKPSAYQTKTIGGKTYVFDPNTGTFYDPRTGRPAVPKGAAGSSSGRFTPLQVQDFKGQAHSLAEDFRKGVPAEETRDGVAIPPRSYGEAIQEALRAGIPLDIFIPILNRYYPPGVGGRPVKRSRLRGYAEGADRSSGKAEPAEGGRGVATEGPSSLEPSLWGAYNYALSLGFTNLGTYNSASRLPSGGISDHAVWPARAFDLGGFSGGWSNPKARRMFWYMTRLPSVEYVILGDKIWSRSRGLHAYTAGGHESHIHVSGRAASGSV